jgi:VanZ family protein
MLKKIIIYWGPVILWASFIFYISSYPTAKTSNVYWQDFTIKKSAHLLFYGIFGVLNYRAILSGNLGAGRKANKAALYAILISLFYGVTDEIHQRFTQSRQSRGQDIVFDTIGAVIGVYTLWRLLQKIPKALKDKARSLHLL